MTETLTAHCCYFFLGGWLNGHPPFLQQESLRGFLVVILLEQRFTSFRTLLSGLWLWDQSCLTWLWLHPSITHSLNCGCCVFSYMLPDSFAHSWLRDRYCLLVIAKKKCTGSLFLHFDKFWRKMGFCLIFFSLQFCAKYWRLGSCFHPRFPLGSSLSFFLSLQLKPLGAAEGQELPTLHRFYRVFTCVPLLCSQVFSSK